MAITFGGDPIKKTATGATTVQPAPTRTAVLQQKEAIVDKTQAAGGYTPGGYVYPSVLPQTNVAAPAAGVTTPYTPPVERPAAITAGPQAPNAAPPGQGANDTLGGFTEQEINAALMAIEAQFGMTREQLLADQTMVGAQYRLLMARLTRQRTQGVEGATDDAVSRGVYRSGILGSNIQGIESQFGEAQSQVEQQRLGQEQDIATQLAFLDQQKAALQADAQAGILRSSGDYALQAGMTAPQADLRTTAQAGAAGTSPSYIQGSAQGRGGLTLPPVYSASSGAGLGAVQPQQYMQPEPTVRYNPEQYAAQQPQMDPEYMQFLQWKKLQGGMQPLGV